MDERMNENAAPCADERALEAAVAMAAGAAPVEKKYVKPAMQVFPLGCGLLAASVPAGPPVRVAIGVLYGVDYYYEPGGGCFIYEGPLGFRTRTNTTGCGALLDPGVRYTEAGVGSNIETDGWYFECGDVVGGSSFLTQYAAKATAMRSYVDECTDCGNFIWASGGLSSVWCGSGLYPTPGLTPDVAFSGADWDVQDFFANAEFDACSGDGSTFSGTYDGRRFEGRIND
ncbi:MAG: hypothetical protein IJ722_01795 [Alloprevotella sp.]|nr:hypothetical protein [Alloprevotella sp.]